MSARPIPLAEADVHVWLAFYDDMAGDHLHDAYRELLDDAERAQERRFHFAKDRRRYLVTRALVRTVLSRYEPLPPREWIFAANAYGRPRIADAQGGDARMSFNVSHTHSLIVLGVTRGRALGVDVENVRTHEAPVEIAPRYFSPREVAALGAVPPHRQPYRFFEYWTFKEAYIKARGMGLSLPLDRFSIHYPDDRAVDLEIDPELDDRAARWQLWQFQPAPDYLVAICAERSGARPSHLIARKAVPMLSEEPYPVELLRVSRGDNAGHHDQRRGAR